MNFSGLKHSLAGLSTFSATTTRRLDVAYSSVLERLGILQGTVVALKELADISQDMNRSFAKESEELVRDVQSHLNSFGELDDQQKRIEILQGRIHDGRERIQSLSQRVDVVRHRIENWERADRDWQEKTRKRLKIMWLITSAILFVMILLLVSVQYAPSSLEEATVRFANESIAKLRDVTTGGSESPLASGTGDGSMRLQTSLNRTSSGGAADEDPRLRLFDEL